MVPVVVDVHGSLGMRMVHEENLSVSRAHQLNVASNTNKIPIIIYTRYPVRSVADPGPFLPWIRNPGWVKSQDPGSRMNNTVHIS